MSGAGCPVRGLVLLVLVFATHNALAHKSSDSYLHLGISGNVVTAQWDVALRDLEYAIGIDEDADGQITWGEVRARHAVIADYLLGHLSLTMGEQPCSAAVEEQLVDAHSDGGYTVLQFSAHCPQLSTSFRIDYALFASLDAQHRGIVRVAAGTTTHTAILGPDTPYRRITLDSPSPWLDGVEFLRQGIVHILIGYDHVLFLVTLLLPAVLVPAAAGTESMRTAAWQPVTGFRPALFNVIRIVTAFTVAHSVTLSLAALGIVTPPSRAVESLIALSIVIAALNNIFPLVRRRVWLLALAFGLVHGFGFANVLLDLGLPPSVLVPSLFAFNLGVEIGQLLIVAILLPLAFAARRSVNYPRVAVVGGSWVIAAVALLWLSERSLNLTILPV